MFSGTFITRFALIGAAIFLAVGAVHQTDAACVWKVTGPNGGTLYLGGSIHGLRSTDYPLPAAYNRAFDLSSRLVREDDPNISSYAVKGFLKSGIYPKGDSLKNHIDPRVYDYLRRFFASQNIPETEFAIFRPWMLIMKFFAGATNELGIEAYLTRRAAANHKSVSGLESFREHVAIISGLTDQQAQLVLLQFFIPQSDGSETHKMLLEAWRRGDIDTIERHDRASMSELPSFYQRLVVARNRDWIPKIERDLQSGQVYFVVAGVGHMGGPDGVIALLRHDGCRIEQL